MKHIHTTPVCICGHVFYFVIAPKRAPCNYTVEHWLAIHPGLGVGTIHTSIHPAYIHPSLCMKLH